eukprot:gnl/TRDRNA2_/TRDRNA2_176035_c0_seq11.p2 gnl/TRDRNA2_/TRDRNA2_176035_c0~~gnl/TRDRNA2_/TRDRNA2_176035_c0_seq11.p2  ORF type:complete len:111 (+),score=30.28 gnl/TRDRNA2_/TRDRNA2_176035_c0_seq11:100-432(+)
MGGEGGFGKGDFGKGKGDKGKGKGKGKKVDPTLKVWIGGLSPTTTWKTLQEHMNQMGATTWVECFEGKGKGTGYVAYKTAEEVATAIASLNGSVLDGAAIQCDYWVKAEA